MEVNNPKSSIENTEIVIIGAGIAGLGAALHLEQSNFKNYILLEAQSRIGGRIHSIPWNNGWLEHGAQFLHGRGSILAQLAEKRNLLSDDSTGEGEGLYLREDGTEVDPNLVIEVDDFIRDVLEDCERYADEDHEDNIHDINLGDNIEEVLRAQFSEYLKLVNDPSNIRNIKEELYDWNVRFLLIDNACSSLEELSVKRWGNFKAAEGPDHNIFKSHYSSIVDLIAKELTKSNLRLNSPVKKVEWKEQVNLSNSKSITITLQDNKKICADCAIVTCSLGFLKENHDQLFNPSLPKTMSRAIHCMGFGMINKVFLNFEKPWWKQNTKGFQFLWRGESEKHKNDLAGNKLALWTRDLTGFDVLKDHEAVLLGWVGGKGALIIETLSEQQIIQDCTELFRYFLKNDSIPKASKCSRTQWASNKYIRGGYSHIAAKCDDFGISPATLAEPIWGTIISNEKKERLPILMLAGEATHDSNYSTTHGAYNSGIQQAQTFLYYHVTKKNKTSDLDNLKSNK